MFHANCPSCGASVEVRSATAVTVVCSYCSSMLVLKDGSLHDTGRDSALLHDFSPIQIGRKDNLRYKIFRLLDGFKRNMTEARGMNGILLLMMGRLVGYRKRVIYMLWLNKVIYRACIHNLMKLWQVRR